MKERLYSRQFTAIASSNLLLAWAFYTFIPTLPIYLIKKDLRISQGHTGLVNGSVFDSSHPHMSLLRAIS